MAFQMDDSQADGRSRKPADSSGAPLRADTKAEYRRGRQVGESPNKKV